jgi:hydrogenase nickel incorporation protein HypA/HybF
MQSVLEMAFARTREAGATHIKQLWLRVGDLSGVVPEALQLAFDAASPGTVAQGAKLVLERVPAECWCDQCGWSFRPEDIIYACPQCGEISTQIETGRELELVSLEVS